VKVGDEGEGATVLSYDIPKKCNVSETGGLGNGIL
jgi:hypothetical protein